MTEQSFFDTPLGKTLVSIGKGLQAKAEFEHEIGICRKCGGKDIRKAFATIAHVAAPDEEILTCTCNACGYSWRTKPLDQRIKEHQANG